MLSGVSFGEIVVVLIVFCVIFKPHQIQEITKNIAKFMHNFNKSKNEIIKNIIPDEILNIEEEISKLDKEIESARNRDNSKN